jgi:hypothetical protein
MGQTMGIRSFYFQCTPLGKARIGSASGLIACSDLDFPSSKNVNHAGKTSDADIRRTSTTLHFYFHHQHQLINIFTFLQTLPSLSHQSLHHDVLVRRRCSSRWQRFCICPPQDRRLLFPAHCFWWKVWHNRTNLRRTESHWRWPPTCYVLYLQRRDYRLERARLHSYSSYHSAPVRCWRYAHLWFLYLWIWRSRVQRFWHFLCLRCQRN